MNQALVLALWENGRASPQENHRQALLKSGKCLVRGITFFGTPFHGSRLANLLAPFVQLARGNKQLVSRLKVKNPDVTTIIERFNQLRAESGYDIPIVCCYEKLPLGGIKLVRNVCFSGLHEWALIIHKVTELESALGLFKGNVTICAIHKDHRDMRKSHRKLSTWFKRLFPKEVMYVSRCNGKDMTCALLAQISMTQQMSSIMGFNIATRTTKFAC